MPASETPSRTSQPLRVLVADDEPMIVRILERILTRRGHEVHAVANAYDAVELLESGPFDAVLVVRVEKMCSMGPDVGRRFPTVDDQSLAGMVRRRNISVFHN